MISFGTRPTLRTAAAVAALTALAAPSTGYSQRAQRSTERQPVSAVAGERDTLAGDARQQQRNASQPALPDLGSEEWQRAVADLQERIRAVESEDRRSADLIGPLAALGLLYQEGGDHWLAAAALQRGVELVRFNHGLHAVEQAPLLRHRIRSAAAVGDAATAWDLEQELLALAGRHPSHLVTARILRETADRRMDVLRRYDAGEWPPEIVLGCYYSPDVRVDGTDAPSCTSGDRRQVKRRLLFEAQTFYAQSINILLQNEQYGSEELPALFMELVRSSYAHYNPALGARSLRYLLAYQTENSEPLPTRMDTLVQIADWELLHSNSRAANEAALATYRQAYALLEERGTERAAIDRIFSPPTPVVLPAFLPNPLLGAETQEASGYIDVEFAITRYGDARKVRIRDAKGQSTRATERRLVALILRSRFRPRVIDGQFAGSGPIVVRHYTRR